MPHTIETLPQTLGQKRVRTSFNPSDNNLVDQIKGKSAEMIDWCQKQIDDLCNSCKQKSPSEYIERVEEKVRLLEFAQKAFEDGAMWAVKGVTGG
jgi:hypothetical protein